MSAVVVGDVVPICESAGLVVEADGTIPVQYIKAGWSLNNRYWGADVLKEAVNAGLFSPGLHNYWNHSDFEFVRKLSDLASAQVGPAEFREGAGVFSRVQPFAQVHDYPTAIKAMAEHIGMSIVAYVDSHPGEVDGREGDIIDRIRAVDSVDYVTRPGAGGAILEAAPVVESVIPRGKPPAPVGNSSAPVQTVTWDDSTTRTATHPADEGTPNSNSTFIKSEPDPIREGVMADTTDDLNQRVEALEEEVRQRTAERDAARAELARRAIRDAVEAEAAKAEGLGAASRARVVAAVLARESTDEAKALLAVGEEVAKERQYVDDIRKEALAGQKPPEPAPFAGAVAFDAKTAWQKRFEQEGMSPADAKEKAERMVN